MGSAATQVAEVEEGLASALFRGLAERTAARELLRAQEYEEDREWTRHGDAYYARFQEGYLCKLRYDGIWTLFLVWPDESTRVLLRGSRRSIERYAQEIICYGPPGGPDYHGGALDWRASDNDATVRAATIGGELRLMPWQGRQHLLLLVQNDHRVVVLGRGLREVLLPTAEALAHERGADTLHLRLGDERINLHGLGAASVVGYVDLQRGGQFVLGPVGDGDFGFFYKIGSHIRVVGVYTLAQVRRGDLGCPLTWSSNAGPMPSPSPSPGVVTDSSPEVVRSPSGVDASRQADEAGSRQPNEAGSRQPNEAGSRQPNEATPLQPGVAPPLFADDARRPSRVVTPPQPAVITPPQPADTTPPQPATTPPTPGPGELPGEGCSPGPMGLSASDLRLVQRHLTFKRKPEGGGSTVVALVLDGLRCLVALDLGDLLMRAEVLRSLLAEQFGIHFDCGARTFRRALVAVAGHTHLLKKVGHRWYVGIGALRCEESALLGWIREVTPPETDDDDEVSGEADPVTDRGAGPEGAAPQVLVEPQVDHAGIPAVTTDGPADPASHVFVDQANSHAHSHPPVPPETTDHESLPPPDRVTGPEVAAEQVSADHAVAHRRTDPPAPSEPILDRERPRPSESAAITDDASIRPPGHDAAPDRRAPAAEVDPKPDEEAPVFQRSGYKRRLRTDGKPTVWRRRWEPLPAEQSASQYPGKKPRGPPRS